MQVFRNTFTIWAIFKSMLGNSDSKVPFNRSDKCGKTNRLREQLCWYQGFHILCPIDLLVLLF